MQYQSYRIGFGFPARLHRLITPSVICSCPIVRRRGFGFSWMKREKSRLGSHHALRTLHTIFASEPFYMLPGCRGVPKQQLHDVSTFAAYLTACIGHTCAIAAALRPFLTLPLQQLQTLPRHGLSVLRKGEAFHHSRSPSAGLA